MRVNVTAHPNSKKPRVETDLLGNLHVYVSEPPIDGRANIAITIALANYFSVPKSAVNLVSGYKSKIKIFEVTK